MNEALLVDLGTLLADCEALSIDNTALLVENTAPLIDSEREPTHAHVQYWLHLIDRRALLVDRIALLVDYRAFLEENCQLCDSTHSYVKYLPI